MRASCLGSRRAPRRAARAPATWPSHPLRKSRAAHRPRRSPTAPSTRSEHYATLTTNKPVHLGRDSRKKVREIQLHADESGYLAKLQRLDLVADEPFAVLVDDPKQVDQFQVKRLFRSNNKPGHTKW